MDSIRYFKNRAKAQNSRLRAAGEVSSLQRVQHQVAVEAGFPSWGGLLNADDMRRQLAIVMDREPTLCMNGFGAGAYSRSLQERREQFARWRAELRDRSDHVAYICEWLTLNIQPRKTINEDAHSYSIKHLAERALDEYVSNGELIAAAILGDYSYRQDGSHSPNALFAMSSRSISALKVQPRR